MTDPDAARAKAVRVAYAWEELQRAEEQLDRAGRVFKDARFEATARRAHGLGAARLIRDLCEQLWSARYRQWLDEVGEQ